MIYVYVHNYARINKQLSIYIYVCVYKPAIYNMYCKLCTLQVSLSIYIYIYIYIYVYTDM